MTAASRPRSVEDKTGPGPGRARHLVTPTLAGKACVVVLAAGSFLLPMWLSQANLTWATGPAPVILTKTFAAAGLASKMKLVMTASDATTLYTQPAGSAANGLVMAASYGVVAADLPSSPLKTAIDELATPYAAKYGGQPSEFAADAYSGAEILFAALRKAAPAFSPSAIQAALNHLSILTPDGKYTYTSQDHSGLTSDDVAIVIVHNDTFEPTTWQKGQYGKLPS